MSYKGNIKKIKFQFLKSQIPNSIIVRLKPTENKYKFLKISQISKICVPKNINNLIFKIAIAIETPITYFCKLLF